MGLGWVGELGRRNRSVEGVGRRAREKKILRKKEERREAEEREREKRKCLFNERRERSVI